MSRQWETLRESRREISGSRRAKSSPSSVPGELGSNGSCSRLSVFPPVYFPRQNAGAWDMAVMSCVCKVT